MARGNVEDAGRVAQLVQATDAPTGQPLVISPTRRPTYDSKHKLALTSVRHLQMPKQTQPWSGPAAARTLWRQIRE